jgi:hypothetical protein
MNSHSFVKYIGVNLSIYRKMILFVELNECHRLDACNLKPFAAAHILAAHHVVAADHVALRFGEAGAVTVVGSTGQLGPLAANNPAEFVLSLLSAVRAGHGVGSLFGPLIEKIAFFHLCTSLRLRRNRSPSTSFYAARRLPDSANKSIA